MATLKKYLIVALILLGFVFINSSYAIDWRLMMSATGEAFDDRFGRSVSSAGDVNNDGYADVIVGAYLNDAGGPNAGRAYIYYGGSPMDNGPDVIMTGAAADDYFGYSVSSAGDVNNDGYADVIVGAYLNDAGGPNAGRAYIYYGGSPMDNVADVIMTGEVAHDCFGNSVSSAGDVNNDGYCDVIVAAEANDAAGGNAGRAYIYYGGSPMNNVADVIMTGEAGMDYFGVSVSSAGDVNNDGYFDVIVGAHWNDAGGSAAGRAYIYYGGSPMDNVADLIMTGAATNDWLGYAVSSAGDVNNDGYADVIVGAMVNDAGGVDAGRAYIYYGGSPMDNVADVIMTGEAAEDRFGNSVSSAGDVNNDGYADVIVGAYWNDAGGPNAGRAYIYYGSVIMNNVADLIMTGEAAGDLFGSSVSSAGDVNNDGYADVIIGAYLNDAGVSDVGKAYLYSPFLFILIDPDGGEIWNVGAVNSVLWKGTERADVYLSVDGGATYRYKIATSVGGADSNSFSFRIPHTPSRFSRIMIVQSDASPTYYPRNFDASDSFFTIQSTIVLLAFSAIPDDRGGVQLSWQTEPSVPEIKGYNLYCVNGTHGVSEKINNDLTTNNQYYDTKIRGGLVTYRLGAVNGWDEEYIVGEVQVAGVQEPLIIYPSVIKDNGNIVFWFPQAFPGETETQVNVSVYDITGRKVRTLIDQKLASGYHSCVFDGKDENGAILPTGTYFILMKTPKYFEHVKFLKLN